MRETFRGYYRLKDDDFNQLWDECIFSFDANILLNIYRYPKKPEKNFLKF